MTGNATGLPAAGVIAHDEQWYIRIDDGYPIEFTWNDRPRLGMPDSMTVRHRGGKLYEITVSGRRINRKTLQPIGIGVYTLASTWTTVPQWVLDLAQQMTGR